MTTRRELLVGIPAAAGAVALVSMAIALLDAHVPVLSLAVLYDAPSAKAKPLFVLGRDTPLEVIVPVEGWIKVRDSGGTIGWVEKKAPKKKSKSG